MVLLSSLVNKPAPADHTLSYAKMIDGTLPLFSSTGTDVYSSDLVQMAIDCIATEISKLQPRHVRTDAKGMQTKPKSAFNRLFRVAPNPIMSTRDFLEKITWILYLNYNAFIYPIYIENASGERECTALWPINPSAVTFLEDKAGNLTVKFDFTGGETYKIRYRDVIHLRKKFSLNTVMGGGLHGRPDNDALLKTIKTDDTVTRGLEAAIKSSLSVRGLLRYNTMLDEDKMNEEKAKFERRIESGDSAILPIDLKADFVDLKPDPKIIDQETMKFIQDRILNWYGTPLKILSGDFDDEDYQAWYEKTLEPIVISLGQAFSRCLFTDRELDVGNMIVFYHRDMMYMSMKSKIDLIKITGEQGLLTDNQKLAILGYTPVEGGDRITQSLNYVDKELINEYQLARASRRQD